MNAAAVRADLEFKRQQDLASRQINSRQSFEQAEANTQQAKAAVQSAQAAIEAAVANVEVLKAQQEEARRALKQQETALAKAERDLSFTEIRAPFDGVIGNRAVQVGDYVQPTVRLASLVPLGAVYVDANFKETQLKSLQPGQPVHIEVDALPGREIEGRVASFAPASGSVFSLLPPDNATGNFTKVVQRVPVRILVPKAVAEQGVLRPGMSVLVKVNTKPGAPQPAVAMSTVRSLGTRPLAACASSGGGRFLMSTSAATASPGVAPAATSDGDSISPRRLVAFLAMVFGMFMAILDIQIVSASLTEIQSGLAASANEITWVQTAYLISEVIMIPLSGFLSRALGTRLLFALSAGGFTIASFMCGLSTGITEMIFWRTVQGFIGGGMIPTVFATAYIVFPRSKLPIVSPMIGLVATLAPTIGPTVGGYLTDALSWHWLFFINVLPGIAVTIAALVLIDFDKPDWPLLRRFDWVGLISMAGFLGALEYVLEKARATTGSQTKPCCCSPG